MQARWRLPGLTDLTAHVDFEALAAPRRQPAPAFTARSSRARCSSGSASRRGPRRCRPTCGRSKPAFRRGRRLTGNAPSVRMGALFKAIGFSAPQIARACPDLVHDGDAAAPALAALARHPPRLLHARGRRIDRHLCDAQRRHRLRRCAGERRRQSRPHGRGARRRAGSFSDLLPDPFPRRGDGGASPGASRRGRAPTPSRRACPASRSAFRRRIAARCCSPIPLPGSSARRMPAGAARSAASPMRRLPPWSVSGAVRARIVAAIGPMIRQPNYETGDRSQGALSSPPTPPTNVSSPRPGATAFHVRSCRLCRGAPRRRRNRDHRRPRRLHLCAIPSASSAIGG